MVPLCMAIEVIADSSVVVAIHRLQVLVNLGLLGEGKMSNPDTNSI